ncbi:hypothetical protein BJF79_01020 [Actinomadura sp. CNU-125]|nr:hypothetical protein BJF79_01020 [Actinomadura sp. CNU-125]
MVPHCEHVLLEGNHRSITTSSRPYQSALYSSIARNSRHAASEIARASEWFLTMLRTLRSSITTTWFSWTSRVDSLCRKSRLRSVMRAWTRATLIRAFSRLADPFCFRARFFCALARRSRSRRSCRGLATFSPVDNVTSEVTPASRPMALSDGSSRVIVSSHRMDTNHRPAASRDTVTVDGSAPSGSGRDHTIASGPSIFASVSSPSRHLNALRVYSADALDFLRALKRGYFARLSKNAANAACRCRSACCSGTLDTSFRNASSSVFFHAVSAAEVST